MQRVIVVAGNVQVRVTKRSVEGCIKVRERGEKMRGVIDFLW